MKPEIQQNADGTLELNKFYALKKIETLKDLLRVFNSMQICFTSHKIKSHNLQDLFNMNNMEVKNVEDLKTIMEREICKDDISNQNK